MSPPSFGSPVNDPPSCRSEKDPRWRTGSAKGDAARGDVVRRIGDPMVDRAYGGDGDGEMEVCSTVSLLYRGGAAHKLAGLIRALRVYNYHPRFLALLACRAYY
mgnify:CR=1 FL=1